jgi:hypothetical protein
MRRFVSVLLCAVSAATCGTGRGESPESFVVAVFSTMQLRDRAGFLALHGNIEDVVRACPKMTVAERAQAVIELAEAREEAGRSFDACMATLDLGGAVFESAMREPDGGEVVTLRWTSCEASLQFPAMRVMFAKGGVRGSFRVTQVMDFAGKWRFRGGARLCEQSSPQ